MAKTPRPWFRKARNAWFVCIGGVQHNLGANKKEAYDEFYRLMRQPAERKVSPHSLPAIVDAFLEWVQIHRSPDTYEWYRYRLQRFTNRYPELKPGGLRPFHVQQWVDSYPSLTTNSRRNYLRAVKRCFKWAYNQGYLDDDLLRQLELPAQERREVFVSRDEFELLLANIVDSSFRDLVVVTWETGCRPQESLRVEARHVDVKNQRWVFPPSEAKGQQRPRIVYLTDEAFSNTRRLMLRFPNGRLFRNANERSWTTDAVNCAFDRLRIRMGKAEMKRRGIVIADARINRLIPTLSPTCVRHGVTVKKTPAELREEAKRKLTNKTAASLAPRYSLYALRHSWATRALESGLDGLTVALLLGHADPSTLARVYQHLAHNPKHLLEQAKRVQTTA